MNAPYYEESEIEKSIIGVCFLDSITLDELVEFGVRDWWFRSSQNKVIWRTLEILRDRGDSIDVVSAVLELEQSGKLKDVPGGPSYITECAGEVVSSSLAIQYARVFRKYVKLRLLHAFSGQLQTMAQQPGQEPEEVLAWIKDKTESIEQVVEEPTETLSELFNQVFAEVTRFDRQPPIQTGFDKIDQYIGGLYPQELTILAGESGIGKTAFLTCILRNVNLNQHPVAFFSLEMGSTILAMRVLSASARIPLTDIREGKVSVDGMYRAIQENASETFYVKTDCWTMQEIESTTRVLARTKGIRVVGIDYIQLVEGLNLKSRNREQEISGIGRACKKLAKDTGTHVIALSQLDDAWDDKPTGRNIRESKALKHHSDNVFILYKKKNSDGRIVRCSIDKGRNNKTGDEALGLIGGFTEFVNDTGMVSYQDTEGSF